MAYDPNNDPYKRGYVYPPLSLPTPLLVYEDGVLVTLQTKTLTQNKPYNFYVQGDTPFLVNVLIQWSLNGTTFVNFRRNVFGPDVVIEYPVIVEYPYLTQGLQVRAVLQTATLPLNLSVSVQ